MADDLILASAAPTLTTGEAPLLETDGQVSLTVNRIAALIEAQSPAEITVQSVSGSLTIAAPGPAGVPGPPGPAGPAGPQGDPGEHGTAGLLEWLDDVQFTLPLSDSQVLQYRSAPAKWVNSATLDGGNM